MVEPRGGELDVSTSVTEGEGRGGEKRRLREGGHETVVLRRVGLRKSLSVCVCVCVCVRVCTMRLIRSSPLLNGF